MTQEDPMADGNIPSSSSFPMSSPSFWTEAVQKTEETISAKRSRTPSPSLDISEGTTKKTRFEVDTSLRYLPNRKDIFEEDDPHSYLANAEYAPNKFGDIGDYMRKKEIKVQTQNRDIARASALEGIPQIFNGLSFYINGNTQPPMEEIRKMILQRGGEVRPVLRNKGMVKFIIAPMLTQSKFKQFERYKVVKEGWILESCKEGRLLDWTRWKLQPEGGWESEGRKGLEGFLAGSQDASKVETKPEQEMTTKATDDFDMAPPVIQPISIAAPGRSLLRPAIPSLNSTQSVRQYQPPGRSSRRIRALSPSSAKPEEPKGPIRKSQSQIGTPQQVISTTAIGEHVKDTDKDAADAAALTSVSLNDEPRTSSAAITVDPVRTSSTIIPISPGATKVASPAKEVLPAKIHKPEGGYEWYHSKEPNEDAARLLKDKEWRLKNTAERGNEGGFIDGYYQNSRLHHLSTWKAELRVLVAAAQRQSEEQSLMKPSASTIAPFSLSDSKLPRSAVLPTAGGEKVIFHVDFDCFFVSCGLATRPHLRGKPAVVCHSQVGKSAASTSEIASASYEARAKGVRNGMSLGKARQLVGDELETIPYEFETYKKFSLAFYTVLMGYADELQAVSVDEALIDVTTAVAARAAAPEEANEGEAERTGLRDPAIEVAEKIRDEVRGLTQGCEVSIGIAHNILLAKLGTRRAKPAGVFHVLPLEIESLLAPLDVEDLPSIGYSIRSKIEEKFKTTVCGELLQYHKGAFRALLGPKTGEMLWGYIRGIDDRKLEPHKERKSISAEMNYGIRFQTQEQADICIADLAAEVSKRMKQVNARGRLLTLKLMSRHPDAPIEPPKFLGHGWCETFNKSTAIGNKGGSATDDPDILAAESVKLLRAMKLDPKELRGVGIQITKLDSEKMEREAGQGTLSFAAKKRSDHPKDELRETTPMATILAPAILIESEGDDLRPSETTNLVPSDQAPPPLRSSSPSPARRQASSREVQAGPSRIASSDGIDPDFLAALPEDLRQEVKQDYAMSKKAAEHVIEPVVPSVKPRERHGAAHITRQLRPKVKTQMGAATVAELPLFGAWSKADQADTVDLTGDDETISGFSATEIRSLGLDPDVFAALPEEMRKEIIEEERQKKGRRSILYRPADTSRLRSKATTRDTTRTASLSPGRSSRGGSPQSKPLAAVSLPPKPSLLRATSLPDVLNTITRWIDSRKGGPPAEKDAGKVRTYLEKCFEQGVGVAAVENAVEVLKYMRVEIEERWEEGDEAGEAWWDVWRGFVGAVNVGAVKRFGHPLRF